MALHKEIARARRLGASNYARYRRFRLRNRIFRIANLVGPARHECPCCGWRGMRFLDFVRENGVTAACVCPRCRSHPRHRTLVMFLEELLGTLPERSAILHFAPERAFFRVFTNHPNLRYFGVDIGRRAMHARADITAIPFRSHSFDLVHSCHVLEHVKDDNAALSEIARVTAIGGYVLTMVPTVHDCADHPTVEFGKADYQGHWRIYGRDLLDRLAAVGLEPSIVQLAAQASPTDRNRFAIHPEPLFVARKIR